MAKLLETSVKDKQGCMAFDCSSSLEEKLGSSSGKRRKIYEGSD
jgi:hypothetical protein